MKKGKFAALIVAGSLILSSLAACNPGNISVIIGGDETSQSSNNSQGGGEQSSPAPQSSGSNANPSSSGSNVNPQPSSSSNPGPGPSSSSINPGPGPSSSSNSSQSSSQPVGGNWNSQQISFMEDALYGLVLPYFEGANVSQMGLQNNVYLSAFDVSASDFQNYVAKLIADGWDMQDIGALMNAPAQCVYMAQRAIETKDGTRYIVLTIACLDDNYGYATNGTLSLIAQDPYVYKYNDAINLQVNLLANAGFSNIDLIPELAGVTHYSFGEYDEEENALYVELYINSNLSDAGFTEALRGANWTIKEGTNEQGFIVAYPPKNGFVLEFKYFATEGILELIFKPGVGWNELNIENFFKKYNKQPIAFPKLEIDGATYQFAEDKNNATYAAAGAYHAVEATMTVTHNSISAATIKNYVGELRKQGFVCNTYDQGESYVISKMIGDDDLYYGNVALVKNSSKPQFVLTIRADGQSGSGRSMTWPGQKVNAALAEATNDSLPIYTGNNAGFKTEIRGSEGYVLVYLDDELAKDAVSNYEKTLKFYNYTLKNTLPDGQNEFYSPNGQIYARAFIDVAGVDYVLYIYFKYLAPAMPAAWPSDDIAKAIKEQLYQGSQITDTIPTIAVENASECYVATNFGGGEFEIRIENIGASYVDNVGVVLMANRYNYDALYQFDTNQLGAYISQNGQMVIHVYAVGNDVMLAVKNYYGSFYQAWPQDISIIVKGWGASKDDVPSFDQGLYIEKLEKENKEMDITIMASDISIAKSIYEATLANAGYTFDNELNGYVTANKELIIGLSIQLYSLVITVKYIGEGGNTPIITGQWPNDQLKALFGSNFIIPKPTKTDISYSLSDSNIQSTDTMKMAMIFATVTDNSADATMQEFGAYLTRQNGYVYNETTKAYEAPNESMPYFALTKIDDNNFIISAYVILVHPWPSDVVQNVLDGWGATDKMPSFEDEIFDFTYAEYPTELAIYVEGGDRAFLERMDAVMAEKNFIKPDAVSYKWISPNYEFRIEAWVYGSRVNIAIIQIEKSDAQWPSEEIAAQFEDWGIENVLPAMTDEVTYEHYFIDMSDENMFDIHIYGGASLASKYLRLLTSNGYVLDEEENSNYIESPNWYISENGELRVQVYAVEEDLHIMVWRVVKETPEYNVTYNSVLDDFYALTGVQLPEMDGLYVEEYPFEEGSNSYCLDIVAGENLSYSTYETLLAFLEETLADWDKVTMEDPSYPYVNFTNEAGDWFNLVWDVENECVYLNVVLSDEDVTVANSYTEGKNLLQRINGIILPEYENVEIGDNSFAKDGTETTFAFSSEKFTSATFDEIVAIFTRKLGDPEADLSYSEEGYLSETWIVEGKMYTVHWNPDTLSIDINIMIYTD